MVERTYYKKDENGNLVHIKVFPTGERSYLWVLNVDGELFSKQTNHFPEEGNGWKLLSDVSRYDK